MEFQNERWVLVCGSCKTKNPQAWEKRGEAEACSSCGTVKDESPRDFLGQKVRVPTDRLGTYSYAIGEEVRSARHYADILKKNRLVIKKA